MNREPWTCPVCGAGVAPWVERCVHPASDMDHGNAMVTLAQPDDGLIEWKGGECPFPDDVRVKVTFRDGATKSGCAGGFDWKHIGRPSDIIAYRVVRP